MAVCFCNGKKLQKKQVYDDMGGFFNFVCYFFKLLFFLQKEP